VRYDVHVVLTSEHSLVVEADFPSEAQQQAIEQIGADRTPETWDMKIHVERGVK
jgi:hypothetical protein